MMQISTIIHYKGCKSNSAHSVLDPAGAKPIEKSGINSKFTVGSIQEQGLDNSYTF